MLSISVRGGKILTKVTSAQQLRKIKQQAHVVLKEKNLQKLSYFKAERFRAGWSTLLASRGRGSMTRAKGV